MTIRKITVNNREYQFINDSRNTRNGFAHDTTLFINGIEAGEASCYYINRTWERYTYQKVMQICINNMITEEYNRFIDNFKTENNIKRMTSEKRAEAKKEFYSLTNIKELQKVYKKLELNEYGTWWGDRKC